MRRPQEYASTRFNIKDLILILRARKLDRVNSEQTKDLTSVGHLFYSLYEDDTIELEQFDHGKQQRDVFPKDQTQDEYAKLIACSMNRDGVGVYSDCELMPKDSEYEGSPSLHMINFYRTGDTQPRRLRFSLSLRRR